MLAYQSDGKGGAKVVEIDEPEEMRIERESREKLEVLATWLQINGVDKLTALASKVATLETKVATLESKTTVK